MEDRRSGKRRGREVLGDLAAWERANGEDNSEAIARLRRNLRRVRRERRRRGDHHDGGGFLCL